MPARVVEVDALGSRAGAWDDAVAAMALPSPFLRSWWLTAIADESVAFVLVLDGDHLLGGLALSKKSLPLLDIYLLLASRTPLCPDHLDVVAAPADLPAVTESLVGWATARGNRLFHFDGVAEHSRIPSWLPHARTSPLDHAPCEPLPATADDYLAARPRSFRKTVRRTRNRFDELGVGLRHVDADGLDAALDAFERLHHDRGDRGELLAELPRLRGALAAGVPLGEAWVDVLEHDTEIVAVSIAFAVCGRVSLYQTARAQDASADNASTMLNLAAIDRAIGIGCTEVDLLRGGEPYKRHYAEGARPMSRVQGAHGPIARLALMVLELARSAKSASRALRAWRAGSGS